MNQKDRVFKFVRDQYFSYGIDCIESSDVVSKTGMSGSAVSNSLKRLTMEGFLIRHPGNTPYHYSLTKKGKEAQPVKEFVAPPNTHGGSYLYYVDDECTKPKNNTVLSDVWDMLNDSKKKMTALDAARLLNVSYYDLRRYLCVECVRKGEFKRIYTDGTFDTQFKIKTDEPVGTPKPSRMRNSLFYVDAECIQPSRHSRARVIWNALKKSGKKMTHEEIAHLTKFPVGAVRNALQVENIRRGQFKRESADGQEDPEFGNGSIDPRANQTKNAYVSKEDIDVLGISVGNEWVQKVTELKEKAPDIFETVKTNCTEYFYNCANAGFLKYENRLAREKIIDSLWEKVDDVRNEKNTSELLQILTRIDELEKVAGC